ncbi:hypothetical protein DUI87_11360 [Hirundo rustica rustica]|uniref:Uncharacterized protein n=1 Tax=Hirundo rustica rustica TaxID=333673 RepID=A0A3M0KDE8_HIRRU|nr:hypothetical protein DUI87_11360 [Hirundo rustica rustica]
MGNPLDRLDLMEVSKAKPKFLQLGQDDPNPKHSLGGVWTESSPEEKDFGVWVDEKFNMTQYYVFSTQRAKHALGLRQSKCGQQVSGGDSSLPSSHETPPGSLLPALDPKSRKELLEEVRGGHGDDQAVEDRLNTPVPLCSPPAAALSLIQKCTYWEMLKSSCASAPGVKYQTEPSRDRVLGGETLQNPS